MQLWLCAAVVGSSCTKQAFLKALAQDFPQAVRIIWSKFEPPTQLNRQ